MTLIPQVVDKVDIPVIAAGGIADSRGMIAAMALGAEAVQLGTRFIATKECIAHPKAKEEILNSADTATLITGRGHAPVRMIKNELSQTIIEKELSGASHEELLEFIGSGRTRAALIDGDVIEGSLMAGQIAGMIDQVITVEDVIQGLMNEAFGILSKVADKL
jgi:enoyl-[acyl-carrier protein] reductase II